MTLKEKIIVATLKKDYEEAKELLKEYAKTYHVAIKPKKTTSNEVLVNKHLVALIKNDEAIGECINGLFNVLK